MSDIQQKIRALMGQGSEYEKLDYKTSIDIANKGDIVEITKDIAAMLSSGGGSLLIGADDTGNASGTFTDALHSTFDEAILRAKLKKYIDEPFDVRVSSAKFDNSNFILIECSEYADGFVVLKADGQYEKNSKTKVVFREGDVFVRHGSASEKWKQHDIRRIIAGQVSKERSEWLKEIGGLGLIPYDNTRSIKATLKNEVNELEQKINKSELNIHDIEVSLDRITKVSIESVDKEDDSLFKASIDTLNTIYNLGFNSNGAWRLNNGFNPVELWYEVLIRIPLIGGVCIESKRYDLAKLIVMQKVDGDDGDYYTNWYRHALTMSARANYSPREVDSEPRSILSATTSLFRESKQYKKILNWSDDEGRTFIVRFDYLAAITIIDNLQEYDQSQYYPSFAFYDKARVIQMMKDILLKDELREKLFKSTPPQLAQYINSIDQTAQREGSFFWHTGQWRGELNTFMQQATSSENKHSFRA